MSINIKKDRFNILHKLLFKLAGPFLSDELYAKYTMRRWFGEFNINEPKTFNEKLQWLKLNDRKNIYSRLADKYAVKEVVADIIGSKYVIDTHFVIDSTDELKFEDLPDNFVLKTNNSSGGNIIVTDKNNFDFSNAKSKLKSWMKQNYYRQGREWIYRDIKPKIICEKLLFDESGGIPSDYKIFCFHGVPKYIQVDLGRFVDHKRIFYDIDWIKQPFNTLYEYCDQVVDRPINLNDMLEIAAKLSADITFCRVDLYSIPEIYFGEITFYPENGVGPFTINEWDLKFGNLVKIIK